MKFLTKQSLPLPYYLICLRLKVFDTRVGLKGWGSFHFLRKHAAVVEMANNMH
jgi:hypothetical protein